jgi:hypothetical protein
MNIALLSPFASASDFVQDLSLKGNALAMSSHGSGQVLLKSFGMLKLDEETTYKSRFKSNQSINTVVRLPLSHQNLQFPRPKRKNIIVVLRMNISSPFSNSVANTKKKTYHPL